jgi:hypothetical protein
MSNIQIQDNYERSSVNLAFSFAFGIGDASVVTLAPRLQRSNDVAGGEARWLEPSARLTGVMGIRPMFRFLDVGDYPQAGGYHGSPWQPSRRCMFSVDGKTWQYFDTTRRVGNTIEFRHNTPFNVDTIYVGRGRQMSVSQAGEWLVKLAKAYPALGPSPSAAAHIPSSQMASYPGQEFIAGEFSPQADGPRVIAATPFYAAQINDVTLMPANGGKRVAVLVSGVHGGEDHANYVLQAIVEAILSDRPEARALRRDFRILVYPMLNAPGRAGGGWRGSFVLGQSGEDDANRHFVESQTRLQIIDLPKASMTIDRAGAPVAWAIDSHGTYGSKWAMFVESWPSSLLFHTQLSAAFGQGIVDEGDSHPGFVAEYLRSLGASPSITLETGDPSPVSDADIAAFGAAVVTTMAGLTAAAAPVVSAPPPAPVPPPAPAGPLVMTESGTGDSRAIVCTGGGIDDMPAMTVMAKVRPTRQAGLAYLMGKGPLNAGLKRFLIDPNGGSPRLTFGLGSSGSVFSPSVSTTSGSVAYDKVQVLEGVWDGGLSGSGITVAIDGVASLGERTNGVGTITSDRGEPMTLMNRSDRQRPFLGPEEWIGVWNRMLTGSERALVRQNGPGAVPEGLVVSHIGRVAPAPPAPASPFPITLNLAEADFTGTATINADGTWTGSLVARGTWR